MKRKQWRLLSLLLIFAMILSMMPATAFASTENGIEGQSVTLPILPDGLQAVEYIVSAGSNQYIDLGFTPNQYLNNLKSEIDLQFVLLANITGGTNGTSETSGTTQFYVPYGIDNKKQFVMQSGAGGSEAKFPADLERHTFILDQKNGTANLKTNGQDNIKNITTAPQDYDYNVYLFARNDKNIRLVTPGSVKIYSAKFYDQSSDSDTLIRNMVPCYTTQAMNNAAGVEVSAGTAGMYDLVEGKLYTNANGGSSVDFLIKPDTVDTGNVTNIDANAITTIPYSAYSSIFGSAEADDTNGRIGAVKSGTNESISFKFNVSEEKEYAITVKCSTDKFANGAFNIALDDGSRTFRIAAKETQPTLAGCQNMGVLSEGVHTLTFRSEKNAPGYYFYEIMIIPTNLTTNKVIPVEGNKVTIANYSDFSKTEGSIFCNEVEKCIGLTSTNDRIEFTFDVQEEKVYTCVFTYANQNSSDLTLNYSIDEKSSSFITQGSGGWLKYLNSDVIDFGKLTAGEHKLSFSGAGTAYNLRSVRLSPKYDENNGCQNDALYISLNDDHTLAWLNQSKENESAGTYELVPAGESYDPVSALPLKKIKGRGNSSWTNATKKGYNITLEERKELISGAGAAKKWCLIGCGVPSQDTTFLPSIAAFELFKELGGSYAISWRMVDLYVNDKYVGLYMLTEKVEINKERININSAEFTTEGTTSRTVNKNTGDITPEEQAILDTGIQEFKYSPDAVVVTDGGYVIEAGYYYNDAACGFKTRKGISFELKEPEYVSLEQMARITAYVQDYEDALYSETGYNSKGKHYSDYLDFESAARLFLVDSFIGNKDMYVTSTYLCIDGDADGLKGKLTSGPAWDYNFYELNSNLYGRNSTGMGAFSWVPQLLKKGDFVAKLNEINNANFKNLIQQMNGSEDTEESLKWWEKKYHDAQLQNDFKWNFGYETNRTTYLNAFSTRVNTWDIIWSESTGALRGVTVTNEDGTLTANAPGATTYQWYKVNADNVTTGTAVPGANGDTFTPTTDGIYYVQVNGKALAGTTASTMISAPYSYVMHTHIYDKVDGQAATCTVDGWKDYYKCNGCEKYFTEATGDKEIPDLEAWKLDEGKLGKTGHSYGTPKYTWNADHTSCTAE
ncbi:MAG: CotH kinase family protein, partial [Anaerovoracaceae bacterium]